MKREYEAPELAVIGEMSEVFHGGPPPGNSEGDGYVCW